MAGISLLSVLTRKDLTPCFISIFMSMFIQMGLTGTLTMQLMQAYDCTSDTAYYYLFLWGAGLTLGNCLSSCLLKVAQKTIYVSYIAISISLIAIGPSSLIPVDFFLSNDDLKLMAMGIGLFILGVFSAFLQTLSNIKAMELA